MQTKGLLIAPLLISVAAIAAVGPQPVYKPNPALKLVPKSGPAPSITASAAVQSAPTFASSRISQALIQWNSLRQTDSLPFSSYAAFLTRFRGWPGEMGLRRTAERAIDPSSTSPREVIDYFRIFPPVTATGHARHAFALQAAGQAEAARSAAREAWIKGALLKADEDRLIAQYAATLRPEDHDRRIEKLLAYGERSAALRMLGLASPGRRALFEARLALQTSASDAAARLAAVGPVADGDPGLLADRARWLRDGAQNMAARALLAGRQPLATRPIDPEKWYEALLDFARGAAADRQWTTAYQIASRLDDAYAPGTDISIQPVGERDDYTSLAWLAGTAALHHLNRPADAAAMFVRYAKGGRSAQVTSKGYYWAGRAALAAGQAAQASSYFEQAAAFPELFYGQLSLERLGRPVPPPPSVASLVPPTVEERTAFQRKDLVEATRLLGQMGRWEDQSLFVRTLAESAETPAERILAADLSRQIGRPDLAVWLARNARNAGSPFYVRTAYPEVAIPPAYDRFWSLAHGIIRQESSFDRAAISHAGARGMMQLMLPTARQTAGKIGASYDGSRLTRDASYNVLLGSAYFAELMDYWGNNVPLAVASYNAGIGNVRKWVSANGDPRLPGADIVRWIEDIPFSETRGYVQRVLENSVVYDTMVPARARSREPLRLSYYLGKSGRPG